MPQIQTIEKTPKKPYLVIMAVLFDRKISLHIDYYGCRRHSRLFNNYLPRLLPSRIRVATEKFSEIYLLKVRAYCWLIRIP